MPKTNALIKLSGDDFKVNLIAITNTYHYDRFPDENVTHYENAIIKDGHVVTDSVRKFDEFEVAVAFAYTLIDQNYMTVFNKNLPELATGYDLLTDGYKSKQYEKGLTIGKNAHYIWITRGGVWGSNNNDGSMTSSYETLGLHACTAHLLSGMVASGCPIVDKRIDFNQFLPTN